MDAQEPSSPFLMWTPGVCAIVTQLVFHPTIAGLRFRNLTASPSPAIA
jgi:hypothetical protein